MPGQSYGQRDIGFVICLVTASLVAVCVVPRLFMPMLAQTKIDKALETHPIKISADYAQTWNEDPEASVSLLRGHCQIVQGDTTLHSKKMVVWQSSQAGQQRALAYLEEDVRFEQSDRTLSQPSLLIELVSNEVVQLESRFSREGQAPIQDALFDRAAARRIAARRGSLQQTQFVLPGETGERSTAPGSMRRVRISPRSAVEFDVTSWESKETTPPEQISILTGGINMVINGVEEYGTVDLTADRMVIWTEANKAQGFNAEQGGTLSSDTQFQVYMEGNIVIRQTDPVLIGKGQRDRVITAIRAFYDAREDRALLHDAEMKTYMPDLGGELRVRADQIRQLSKQNFHAQRAWATTSKFGKPGYRLQASDIFLEQRYSTPWFGRRADQIDPATGAPIVEDVPWITSLNNTFLVGNLPLMYTPYMSGPADINIPLRSATIKQDQVFGSQVETIWDIFKLLSIDKPGGTDWTLLADYYSERGPGVGTKGRYQGNDLFGIPGPYRGYGFAYYLNDTGTDRLGGLRFSLPLESNQRGRFTLRQWHDLPQDMALIGEIGYLSDRNYLEQYFKQEFDAGLDNETLIYLKQNLDNTAWSALVRPRLNNFSYSTEWFPRGDLYVLSEPLFGGLLTWSNHSSAGYAHLRNAVAPTEPLDVFTPLPFVDDLDGAVVMSRHQVDMPLDVGPIKIVPYAMGEAAFWSQDFNGQSFDRFVGSAGVNGSIMFWRVFPSVQSRILNLNGLAHKMVVDAEYAFTESTEDLANIPQYNEFDENSQERFRTRLITNTFGGNVPPFFEPRFYAVRTGAGRAVSAAYHELIDDQQVVRLGWSHRLQTKVGPPENLRIRDWMRLDLTASYFPNKTRDNFGEDLGLLGARYNWQIGDRTRVFASAYYDPFQDAQQLWNFGLLSDRPRRGSTYLGIRQIKGAGLNSQILTASFTYRTSEKWMTTLASAYDLGEQNDLGQSMTVTRVGADFLFHFGAVVNPFVDNVTFAFSITPRFGPPAATPMFGSLLNAFDDRRQ